MAAWLIDGQCPGSSWHVHWHPAVRRHCKVGYALICEFGGDPFVGQESLHRASLSRCVRAQPLCPASSRRVGIAGLI
jgi:hypothetical protein